MGEGEARRGMATRRFGSLRSPERGVKQFLPAALGHHLPWRESRCAQRSHHMQRAAVAGGTRLVFWPGAGPAPLPSHKTRGSVRQQCRRGWSAPCCGTCARCGDGCSHRRRRIRQITDPATLHAAKLLQCSRVLAASTGRQAVREPPATALLSSPPPSGREVAHDFEWDPRVLVFKRAREPPRQRESYH